MRGRIDGRTALVTAACIGLVLAPLGVKAATDSVVIRDNNTQQRANVSGGELHVGDGNGALTVNGTVQVSRDQDNERVIPGSSNRFYVARATLDVDPAPIGFEISGDLKLFITNLTLANSSDSADADVEIRAVRLEGAQTCETAGTFAFVTRVNLAPNETLHLAYPQALVVNEELSQDQFCVVATRGDTETAQPDNPVFITLNGYTL
jgi:hypothetical protein